MSPYELENLPHTLKRVRTQSIFVIRLEVMPLQVIGQTPGAHRRVGVITGGEFYGKHLSGKALGGGSDWVIVRDDGSVELDVRLVLQTDDDALIAMTYRGVRHGPVDIIERLHVRHFSNPCPGAPDLDCWTLRRAWYRRHRTLARAIQGRPPGVGQLISSTRSG